MRRTPWTSTATCPGRDVQTPQPMPSERPPLHASLEPRVAQTLAACPFVVGFQQRVALFQGRVEKDRQQRQSDAGFDMSMRPLGFRVKVRRDQIFEDAFPTAPQVIE